MIFQLILRKNEMKNKLKTDKQVITYKNKATPKINVMGDMK
jgi:hypothetical protein